MSCCLALQTKNEFYLAVDTAVSGYDNIGNIWRVPNEKIQKISKHGKDLVFMAGSICVINIVNKKLDSFLQEDHIDISALQKYLKENFPCKNKETKITDLRIVIYQIINNQTKYYSLEQGNNYIPDIMKGTDKIQLAADGAYNIQFGKSLVTKLQKQEENIKIQDLFFEVFQENYCEAVGNSVMMYQFSNDSINMVEYNLKEKNLSYTESYLVSRSININDKFIVDEEGNVTLPPNATMSWNQVTNQPTIPVLPSYITQTKITSTTIESPTITGDIVNAGTINGGEINGVTINGSNFFRVDENGNRWAEITKDCTYFNSGYFLVGNRRSQNSIYVNDNGVFIGGDISDKSINQLEISERGILANGNELVTKNDIPSSTSSLNARFTSSSLGIDDLIAFSGAWGSNAAATPNYVKSYVDKKIKELKEELSK